MERSMVEHSRERVPAGALGQLTGHALEVGDDAAVKCSAGLGLAVAVEHAPQDEEFRCDLGRRKPEAFALARVIVCKLDRILIAVKARDEGWKGAQLSQTAEPLERRDDAVGERLLHALDREVPCRCPHDPGHGHQPRERFG